MQILLDMGAEQVAGRIIYQGKDLAREVSGRWELLPAGEEMLSESTVDADGVEVLAKPRPVSKPVAKSTRRRAEAVQAAEDADLSKLDDLIQD